MELPIGTDVEVTIDNSHIKTYLSNGSKHRVDLNQVLRGTIVGAPSWLKGPHVCLLNSETKVLNMVPEHRILSINNKPMAPKTIGRDRVFTVTSTKTDEVYTIRLNGQTRQWSCNCTGWQFHKKCRHTVRCEHKAERVVVRDMKDGKVH